MPSLRPRPTPVHALRALVYLARHRGAGLVAAHTIAEAEGLSEEFLVKALRPLVTAGVLRSERGRNRGSRLARPARSISLLEVVEAVNGPVRGEAPRVGVGEAARLNARLQRVCEAVAETVRLRQGKVNLADLAGVRK
jgi:Rrf2 family protein